MTEELKQEMERCKDPLYFHNKYLTYPGKRVYTQEEWDAKMNVLRRAQHPIKFRNNCTLPCSPSDWYKGGKCDKNGCYHE